MAEGSCDLNVEVLRSVAPLDDQFGKDPKVSVPAALEPALFGADAPETGLPMNCYALLDAAKLENLPERLAQSELEHRCLFKGEAEEDLSSVAPWVVRLEQRNKFTRHLFTAGKAPWYGWDRGGAVFLRSGLGIDAIWRHYRKLTRVHDPEGKWYFLRFYDPACLPTYLRALEPAQREKFFGQTARIICKQDTDWFVMSQPSASSSSSSNSGSSGSGK